jgi:hypothetical protein
VSIFYERHLIISGLLVFICIQYCYAGPPFYTDDPQPVDYKHWEYYISSINNLQDKTWSGTCPHLEVNYGLVPNIQVHLLAPMNYSYSGNQDVNFGYAYTEFGIKYRFLQETDNLPQIGVFPIIEVPTIKNNEFGNGKVQFFIPVWAQKTWGKITTYGGAGYWINPGTNNKNWLFTGWEIQYNFSPEITLGGELYYHTKEITEDKSMMGFNIGGSINFTEKFHLIFSLGHSITNVSLSSSYLGLLWTI